MNFGRTEIKEAMDLLTKMSADPETRAEYEARQKELNDFYAGQSVKYEEGLQKGREEGEKVGRAEGEKIGREEERAKAQQEKIESAKKMLTKGLEVGDISDFTGLSIEEIESLK